MSQKKSIWIVLPAYNEDKMIGKVVADIRQKNYHNIIVVDDGSTDSTGEVAEKAGAVVIKHTINRGAGAATQTGIIGALRLGAEIIVTMDSDSQHDADDIKKITVPIEQDKCDVVIGSRLKDRKNMPVLRRFFNLGANLATWIFFGLWVSDSQSGFKAFSRKAAQQIRILTNGFEFCSELIREIKVLKLAFTEVPIKVYYNEYSMAKGQSFARGLTTLFKLIMRRLIK